MSGRRLQGFGVNSRFRVEGSFNQRPTLKFVGFFVLRAVRMALK